jgi:arabinofuranosyltransferase
MQPERSASEGSNFKISPVVALVLLLALISLLPLLQTWNHRRMLLNDDSLITLTFSRNLGEGKGFIYNSPPAILGTTAPFWALLCAFGHYILPIVPLTSLAVLLSGFFWVSAIWALFIFRWDFRLPPLTLLAAAAVIASLNWPAALGMESFLFLFLMLLSCGLFFRGRLFWSGFAVALLFLTRGEGILLLGIQLAWLPLRQLRQKKKLDFSGVLKILSGFVIPFCAWAAYALPTFHQILPGSLGVKIAQARSGLWPSFWQQLWNDWLPSLKSDWQLGSPWLNAWIMLIFLGLAVMVLKRRPLRMALAWLACYVAGYSLLGVAAYTWYMIPITWATGLAAAEGIAFLAGLLGKWRPWFFKERRVSRGVILAFSAALLIPVALTMNRYRPHPKCQTYLEICRWIERNASPSQSIAYFEVGYLGFYTRNPIVDQMGLVTPGAADAIARRDFSSIFWTHDPDYLLLLDGSGFQYHIVSDPRFRKNYFPAATFAGWGGNSLAIFKRR